MGGHSGLQIHQGLGNAVQLLAGALAAVMAAAPGTRLVELRAGEPQASGQAGRAAHAHGWLLASPSI